MSTTNRGGASTSLLLLLLFLPATLSSPAPFPLYLLPSLFLPLFIFSPFLLLLLRFPLPPADLRPPPLCQLLFLHPLLLFLTLFLLLLLLPPTSSCSSSLSSASVLLSHKNLRFYFPPVKTLPLCLITVYYLCSVCSQLRRAEARRCQPAGLHVRRDRARPRAIDSRARILLTVHNIAV